MAWSLSEVQMGFGERDFYLIGRWLTAALVLKRAEEAPPLESRPVGLVLCARDYFDRNATDGLKTYRWARGRLDEARQGGDPEQIREAERLVEIWAGSFRCSLGETLKRAEKALSERITAAQKRAADEIRSIVADRLSDLLDEVALREDELRQLREQSDHRKERDNIKALFESLTAADEAVSVV